MIQILSALLLPLVSAQYTATYLPTNTPDKSEAPGQIGTNQCGTASSQDSLCQNVYINSVDDFCLWGPPYEGSRGLGDGTNKIGNIEQIVVAYCLKDGYGTRLIPQGTITAAHFVKVKSDKVSYVQVTGSGDLTKMGLVPNDDGGELDPHSWTGLGNPEGGLVFTNAFGNYQQTHEWTSFMSSNDFCIRACVDGPNAPAYCQHIYDVLSCGFTIPGSFDPGFDNCEGEPTDEAPGVYSGSTFSQGDPSTPAPHPAGPTSQCTPFSTIGGGSANLAAMPSASASSSASSNSSMSSNSTMSSSISMSMSANSSMSMSMSSGSASASASSSATGPARITSSSSARSGSGSASPTASAVDAASASTSPNAAGKVEMRGVLGMGSVVVAGILGGLMVLA